VTVIAVASWPATKRLNNSSWTAWSEYPASAELRNRNRKRRKRKGEIEREECVRSFMRRRMKNPSGRSAVVPVRFSASMRRRMARIAA
jgi:hypothetical protein